MCHMLHNALPSGHSSTVYRTHTARAYQYLVNPNIIRHSTFRDEVPHLKVSAKPGVVPHWK